MNRLSESLDKFGMPLSEDLSNARKQEIQGAAWDVVSSSKSEEQIEAGYMRLVQTGFFQEPDSDATDEEAEAFYESGIGSEELRVWDEAVRAARRELEAERDQQDNEATAKKESLLTKAAKEFMVLFPRAVVHLNQGRGGSSHYFVVPGSSKYIGHRDVGDDEIKFRVADHDPVYDHSYDFRYDKGDNESLEAALDDMLEKATEIRSARTIR